VTPDFARIVDPVFLAVLDFVDRFEHGKEEYVDEEARRIRALIEEGDRVCGGEDKWQLAKYALVTFIDEQYSSLPWRGRDWWVENSLEYYFFFERPRGDVDDLIAKRAYYEFYEKANQAARLANKDALEVFVTCVLLGFRGMYDRQVDPAIASRIGVPNSQKEWLRQMSGLVTSQPVPPFDSAPERGNGARPLDGRSQMITMGFMAFAALAAAVTYYLIFIYKILPS
jgi:type IV/VI secretion system ImpK/VasF family protein